MSRPSRTARATRPAINPRYLSEESDRRAIVGGLRFAQRLFAASVLQQFVREEPGPQIQTDDELLDYGRRYGGTCYHASCTCLGSHPMSVVDSELCVHGVDGLRVIDASVMPAVTSTNANAPTIMIAEYWRRRAEKRRRIPPTSQRDRPQDPDHCRRIAWGCAR